jgi:uncharacterized protein with ParB-like and HNH nuclease domain
MIIFLIQKKVINCDYLTKNSNMSTYIESEMKPIGTFMSDSTIIRVPPFQRSYSWTDEEVKQLWIDITEAIDSNQPEYFLGPMVVKRTDNYLEIIDGQQRVTTIFILLSIIRRIFSFNQDRDRGSWFQDTYFGKRDVNTLEIEPKFHMNEENDFIFKQFIINDIPKDRVKLALKEQEKKNSNFYLLQAILSLYEFVEERLSEISKSFDRDVLLKINNYIQKNTYILLLIVTDEADAYAIFETLNDRGRSLTTMDLLKNHIFGHAKSYLDQAKTNWAIIRDNLNGIDSSERFLNHYWTSIHGRTSKNKLFRLMRDDINSARSAIDFVKKLADSSKLYSDILNANNSLQTIYDTSTIYNLSVLNLLEAQQTLPILLAASKKFDSNEMRKLTSILVVMAVRYNLIGELRTGVSSNYYSDIPPEIQKGNINKAAKVFRSLKSLYPKDDDFREAFSKKVIRDSRKVRYVLSEIEKFLNNSVSQIVNDPKLVNLEHILPKNHSGNWGNSIKNIDKDDIQDYIYRIGNVALTTTQNNKIAGAKDFTKKKELIFSKEDKIKTTLMINDYQEWNIESIEDRQKKLANYAVNVWRIDIE